MHQDQRTLEWLAAAAWKLVRLGKDCAFLVHSVSVNNPALSADLGAAAGCQID